MSIYVGQIEALSPNAKTIYIEFVPTSVKRAKETFTVELKKNTKSLAEFLKKIKAKTARRKAPKVNSYTKLAQEILNNRLGEIYVQQKDIQSLINKFNILPRAIEGLKHFSRTIVLSKPVQIEDKIYPANTNLKIVFEG